MFKKIALGIQSVFNSFDPLARGRALDFSHPGLHPIFIIGAPRSGSTLFYQLMLKHIKTAYISNFTALLPCKMIFISRYLKPLHEFYELKESDFGYISGLFAPSEAGTVQRKWFESEYSYRTRRRIRNTLILLSEAFSGPFVSKNLMNTTRLDNIRRILPEARYIYIRRDPLFNAQSLLLARRKVLGTDRKWWSVKPQGYPEVMKRSPEYQVVWQVVQTENIIMKFLEKYSPNFLQIRYEDLCEAPESHLARIVETFQLRLKNTHFDKIAEKNSVRLSPEEWGEIKISYTEIMNQPSYSGARDRAERRD